MKKTFALASTLLVSGALVVGASAPAMAAATVVVYEDTAVAQGWDVTYQRDGGSVDWTADGLKLSTPAGNDKITFGTPLAMAASEVNELSYEIEHLSDGSIPSQRMAINLVADFNGAAAGGFTTLVYEPVYNGGSFDAYQGGDAIWWSSNPMPGAPNRSTFVSWETLTGLNPDMTLSLLAVNQGGGNAGLVDVLETLTFQGTTYQFVEGAPPVQLGSAAECKKGGWATSEAPVFKNQGDCVSWFATGSGS